MFILASQSPRRKELLKTIIDDFQIIPANIDEEAFKEDEVSYQKGIKIALEHKSDTIISADTIVKLNGKTYGKPKDDEMAKQFLRELSGNTHEVITYYSIINLAEKVLVKKSVTSYVIFNELSEELIDAYVQTKSPLDKAGGYGLQDNDKYPIIKGLKGSHSNIIGFPIEEIKEDLINNKLL